LDERTGFCIPVAADEPWRNSLFLKGSCGTFLILKGFSISAREGTKEGKRGEILNLFDINNLRNLQIKISYARLRIVQRAAYIFYPRPIFVA
jgi:hypothetical protein